MSDCYNYPQYWDLAFRDETKLEADFIVAAAKKYCDFEVRRLLEPGCGGGRLVVEMASRGFNLSAFDLNSSAIKYLKRRLRRRQLTANVFVGDMVDFDVEEKVDVAFCTFNTFRHLISEADAAQHLKNVARCLRPGGLYILGLHLLPLDVDEDASERCTAKHGRTHVTLTLRVVSFDRERRVEIIRFSLLARNGKKVTRVQSEYPYRIYTADQLRQLLTYVDEYELCDVFDFWYEIENPLKLDDQITDTVCVLRKKE